MDSDFDSFSESSSDDDRDDVEFRYGGQACSILSSLEETIGKIDDFLSFERGFMHGDIVCSANDSSHQMGKVVDVDMTVDLENIHGSKMRDVNSKILKRIRSISVGDYVVYDAWLGKVQKIVDHIFVLFDDGTKSVFSTMGPEKLVPISPDILEDSQYPFYPGQRVQVESLSVSKPTRWLCGVKKDNLNQGTVCSVDAGLVYVDWLGCEMVGGKISTPPCLQEFKNLTLLPCFTHANWQLGDWCIPVTDCKNLNGNNLLSAPACGLISGEEKLESMSQRGNLVPNSLEIAVITKTKTKLDVLWQDGRISLGLDSNSLLPVSIVDAHDFWPEQFVLEKGLCNDSPVPGVQRWGIVKCVDAKERTVKVKWNTVSVDQSTNVTLKKMEEIVSAYELIEHPDYSYSRGDVVFRLQKYHYSYQSPGKGFGNYLTPKWDTVTGTESDHKYTGSYRGQNENSCDDFLSCFGIVVGFKDGDVEVKWANGATTLVAPYEIYQVDKCEGLSATVTPYNEHAEPSNEAMVVLGDQPSEHRGQDNSGFKPHSEECENRLLGSSSSSSSFPQAAIGLFSTISSILFGSLSSSLFGAYRRLSKDEEKTVISNEEELELCDPLPVGTLVDVGSLEISEETNSVENIKEVEEEKDCVFPSSSKHPKFFRQFDMVNDCSDHHFVDGAGKGQQPSQMKRAWLKRVQQEWSILDKNLPETIFVRSYEDRLGLLRAVLLGVPGTPYHDGLFFFDIFLPAEYPYEPPMVYYHSGGLRVNPNLYESGKVCLSLLNTWSGSGNEVWNPENSTILQVLLSLQALVLNEKPYFNEAGYDLQIGKAEGEKNSVSYNENAFLVSCKSMLYLLHKPPKHFEAFIKEHFSQRCKHILLACKAYMDGAPVGSAHGNGRTEQEIRTESSMGFKVMLAKLFPKLVEAFSAKGIDCSDILNQGE